LKLQLVIRIFHSQGTCRRVLISLSFSGINFSYLGDFMKIISTLLVLLSLNAFADETCNTTKYDFRITNSYIEVDGNGDHYKMHYDEVRSLSRRNLSDFKTLLNSLSDETNTDEPLSIDEASLIERFSLTVADDKVDLLGIMYAKGYAKSGLIVARYMVTDGGAYRCR
jgi:hypothetical protein